MPDRAQLERRTTELLQRLIRLRTVNPPGHEEAAQELLRGLLEAAGFDCELLAAIEGRPNLIARLRARSDGPRLCLLGHVDTVLADPADWSVDPWSGELRDGCVWGRGAKDMKSQVAAEAVAAIVLAEAGWRPEAGELMLVFTCDEETGAHNGAQWLCAEHPGRVSCDLVVNEGAGELMRTRGSRVHGVCVGEKGVYRFTLRARGRPGHASVPAIGDNALVRLAPLVEALAGVRPPPLATPEAGPLLAALGLDPDDPPGALGQLESESPELACLIEPMLCVTLAPTMMSASEKINVIPARAELGVDCRVPPGLDESAVLDTLRAALGDDVVDGGGEARLDFSFDDRIEGNRSAADGPLMDSIRGFVTREDPGAGVAPVVMTGFSDSHWWRRAFPGCTAYGFFPQREMDLVESFPLMHGVDERMPVADLGLAASFYAELVETTLR